MPVVVSIWLSSVAEMPGRQQPRIGTGHKPSTFNVAPRTHPLNDVGQVVLRHGEQHRDRLHLSYDDKAAGAASLDVVALIDLTQPDLPVDG